MALLERGHELASGRDACHAAAAGHGGVVVVAGPPGIGRSVLLAAMTDARPAEFAVLRADGVGPEQGFGFGVVQQLLQPLVAGGGPVELNRWFRGAAGRARPLLLDEPWSTGHVVDETVLHALHTLLVNVSEDGPVLVVVDDLQWADGQSLRWLGYLARRLHTARIVLVGAVSDGCDGAEPLLLSEFAATATHTWQPAPLSVGSVRALAEEEFDVDCSREVAQACHVATGGNPAALTAVLSGMRATGTRSSRSVDYQPMLSGWRGSCLATAPATVRGLADALAVLDEAADPDLLREVAGLDRLAYKSALAAMDRLGLLADSSTPRLVHQSLRADVLAATSGHERQRLHRSAARLLREAGLAAAVVADHLLLAGVEFDRGEEAVLRSAAGAALERGAVEAAARYLRAALLNHPDDGPRRARLLVDLAATERSDDPGSAARHVEVALPFLEPGVERATAALGITPFLAVVTPSLADVVRQSHAQLAEHDPGGRHRELAVRLTARARLLSIPGPDERWDWPSDAAAADLAGTGAGREWLAVLAGTAALGGTRPSADVATLATRVLAREPATPAHVHTALPILVPAAVAADSVAALADWLDLARDTARRRGSAGERAVVEAEWALALTATGRLAEAKAAATDALAAAGPDWPLARALACAALADVAMRTQDVELARRLLADEQPVVGPEFVATGRLLHGMVDTIAGDLLTALDRFFECGRQLEHCGRTGVAAPSWRPAAVAAHRGLGDLEAADALAAEEERAAQAWGSPLAVGRALLLRASLATGAKELRLLSAAVDVLRGSSDRLELAGALVTLGRWLRAAGRSGANQLAEGELLAAECGAYWGDGVSPYGGPVPKPRRSGRASLTRTEDAVVALVRRGWTNQRIADELGVTRRAVEKTLTGAYRKLGVPGRAALRRELGRSE